MLRQAAHRNVWISMSVGYCELRVCEGPTARPRRSREASSAAAACRRRSRQRRCATPADSAACSRATIAIALRRTWVNVQTGSGLWWVMVGF